MISGFFANYGLKLLIVLGIALGLVGALFMYRSEVREAVYQQFYAEQVENQLKNKQIEIDTLNRLVNVKEVSIRKLSETNAKTRSDLVGLRSRLDNDKTVSTCEVSSIVKSTLEDLRKLIREKTNAK